MRTDKKTLQEAIAKMVTSGQATTRRSISTIADTATLKRNQGLLRTLSKEIPPSPINGFASLVNFAPTADQPIHRWFRYREGYSVELVKELIRSLPHGSLVLDPFCGAGTTLLAARQQGLPSIGLDVNPISTLVSKVKTTTLPPKVVEAIVHEIKLLRNARPSMHADPKPALKIIDKVFDAEILHALLVYRRIIKNVDQLDARDFIFVAWLSILESLSNVYKEGNGLKYKNRKRTEAGYIHLDLDSWQSAVLPADRFSYVKERLIHKLEVMLSDLAFMPRQSEEVKVIEAAAERLGRHVSPNSVAMSIFSPPYCNCFNYFKMYKIELWMGEFVSTYDELKLLNRRGLRSHVETILQRDGDKIEPISELFASQLDGIKLWDRRIPKAVRGYFIDMAEVLAQLHSALKPLGKCVIVVGNSAYGGIVIPTDAILAKIANRLGFKVEKLAVARPLTTSSQQRSALGGRKDFLRESLLVLVKDNPGEKGRNLIVVDELPIEDTKRHNNVFSIRNSGLTSYTHKFHRYPGKFIPHVPRWAIKRFLTSNPSATILDPFCGSGTTLVESSLHGYKSFGIDVDPIAKLVSRVKTHPLDSIYLQQVVTDITAKVQRRSKANFRPSIPNLLHWFSEEAVADLGVIRDAIEDYRKDCPIYDFLIVCFAAIIRRSSNADNQTQKTYVSHTKVKQPEAAKPLFLAVLRDYTERILALSKIPSLGVATVIDAGDARNFSAYWNQKKLPKVDLIISSPPYLNSVDYVYNQMAEYFWIGDLFGLETQGLQNEHKRHYVGTTKVDASIYRNLRQSPIKEINSVIEAVAKKSKKNAFIVAQYFSDMTTHFADSLKVLKPRASYICVVGDNLISGEPIAVHELIAKCAESVGFTLQGLSGYEIRNRHMRFPRMGRGGLVRYDWVLELNKD